MIRKIASIALCLAMLVTLLCGCGQTKSVELNQSFMEILSSNLAKEAEIMMHIGEDANDYVFRYEDDIMPESNTSFPEKFDLREQGFVTSVKDQGGFGTCWTFSFLGASESSILSELGITNDEYIEQNGTEFNLSELFFDIVANTSKKDDGSTEGYVYYDETIDALVNGGGNNLIATATIANNLGIKLEEDYPYTDDIYTVSAMYPNIKADKKDVNKFIVQNTDNLISPVSVDENGNYKYNQAGTDSIKKALLDGKAVEISIFYPGERWLLTKDEALYDLNGLDVSQTLQNNYVKWSMGKIKASDLSKEDLIDLMKLRLDLWEYDVDMYDYDALSFEELAMVCESGYFSYPYDTIVMYDSIFKGGVGINVHTSAEYVNGLMTANHGVLIVGYDDNYSRDNFYEGCKPEKDGAWIYRNSWGPSAGDNGYYYVSYYDQSLASPAVVDYYVGEEAPSGDVTTYAYDYINACSVSSTLFDEEVECSSIYTVQEDGKLFALGAYTDNLNTELNVKMYKLKDDYKNPTDGELVYETTKTVEYGGYHTIDVDKDINLKAGDVVSIVVTQKVQQGDNTRYSLVNTWGLSKKNVDALNDGSLECYLDYCPGRYNVSCIDKNENFVLYNGSWMDWSDIVAKLESYQASCGYMTYDNLPIKMIVE